MRLTDEKIAALRDDLTKRLEIKADMLAMGERIAFGSDSAIMRQAAETVHALASEVLESRAAEERWRSNSRETFDAMVAMRNDINEHIPLPSIDSDLARGPGNDVFCAEVAQGVVTALVAKDTEIERLTKERDEARQWERLHEVELSRTMLVLGHRFTLVPPDGGDVRPREAAKSAIDALAAAEARVAELEALLDVDRLTDIITDSIDLDWTPRDAAKAIVRAMGGDAT